MWQGSFTRGVIPLESLRAALRPPNKQEVESAAVPHSEEASIDRIKWQTARLAGHVGSLSRERHVWFICRGVANIVTMRDASHFGPGGVPIANDKISHHVAVALLMTMR